MKIDIGDVIKSEQARRSHLKFMEYLWYNPQSPLLIGHHTRAICSRIDKAIQDYRNGKSTYLKIKVPFRHGKALQVNTPIPTISGWKTIETLSVGDYVFNGNGKPTMVIAKTEKQINRPVYSVSINNGQDVILADENHLWKTKLDRRSKWKMYDTKTMANKRRFSVPLQLTPVFYNKKNVFISPYVLGLWLGDGNSRAGSVTIGKVDQPEIIKNIENAGYSTSAQSCGLNFTINGIRPELKKYNLLLNKHIPRAYIENDINTRMDLLRGLIDSDGEVGKERVRANRNTNLTNGQITFTNKNQKLCIDMCELVRSLGVRCSITVFDSKLNGKSCGRAYKVSFYMANCSCLTRKNERTRNATKFILNSARVKFYGYADTMCIQVDSEDGMFLCGKSMVPTHNSDIVSRYLPANFIGKFPNDEIIVAGYSSTLVWKFSRFARNLMRNEKYKNIYPEVSLSGEVYNVDEWGIDGHNGLVQWRGIGGSITGAGGNLIILDDFFKGREEAESEKMREKIWDSIMNDLMTRCAPTVIFIVLATPWHVDDVFGRIDDAIKADVDFPRFEEIKFPARSTEYPSGYLFPERFDEHWYKGMYASLGPYGSSGLLDCDPHLRSGNILSTENIHIIDEMPEGLQWVRGWDLASSEKQTVKSDPDFTVGVKMAVKFVKSNIQYVSIPIIYVDDVIYGQWLDAKRNEIINGTAISDGDNVRVGIEAFGAYKDAYTTIRDNLKNIRNVTKVNLPGDKVSKVGLMDVPFSSGNVYFKRASWNNYVIEQLGGFPSIKHDDVPDAFAVSYSMCKTGGMLYTTKEYEDDNSPS